MASKYTVDRVDIKVPGSLATVKIVVDAKLPARQVKIATRGRGVSVSASGGTLTIQVSLAHRVKNTGNAIATGGGTANTGIMIGGSAGKWSKYAVGVTKTVISSSSGPKITITMAPEVLYRTFS